MRPLFTILVFFFIASDILAQSTPIVMQSADSLYVNRKTGNYTLFRNVKFKHDSLRFATHYANWDKKKDNVIFKGGLAITHPQGMIKSKSGRYSRRQNRASAYGNVFMTDSLGELTLNGDTLDYKRDEGIVNVWGKRPTLTKFPNQALLDSLKIKKEAQSKELEEIRNKKRVEKHRLRQLKKNQTSKPISAHKASQQLTTAQSNNTVSSIAKSAERKRKFLEKRKAARKQRIKKKTSRIQSKKYKSRKSSVDQAKDIDVSSELDTLTITADRLRYMQDQRQANAMTNVHIIKGEMDIQCDSAFFDYKEGYLKLSGSPQARVGSYFVKGIKMEIWLDGSKLEKIKVWGDAFGQQSDSISDPDDVQWTEVEGDSMVVIFKNDDVDFLRVDGQGEGRFFDESKKSFVNKINGKSLTIDFENSQPKLAKVRDDARTKYFFFKENGVFGGWNEAQGDSLDLQFEGSKLEKISIKGNLASGIFMGVDKDEK